MTRTAASLLALALVVPLTAQQPQPQAPPVFRSGAQLTVETVTVKDKSGKPIEGLTAKDFSITEDGVPQTISFVEFQRVPNPSDPLQAADAVPAAPAAVATPPRPPEEQHQISPSAPGDIRYRDRRLLVLYFDLSAMPPNDLMRAYGAGRSSSPRR
jgi:hypothetical protein